MKVQYHSRVADPRIWRLLDNHGEWRRLFEAGAGVRRGAAIVEPDRDAAHGDLPGPQR